MVEKFLSTQTAMVKNGWQDFFIGRLELRNNLSPSGQGERYEAILFTV